MDSFRNSLKNKKQLVGTFVKTPDPIIIEVLALSHLDYIILDAEHAPFGRRELDQCVMMCRAINLPCIIRLPDSQASTILNALDIGATGIQVPHVKTSAQAEEIIKLSTYGKNGRGYAGSTRQANYGTTSIQQHLKNNENPLIIAQIEDIEGVENIKEISQVQGLSALFIGRVDLTIAYDETDVNCGAVEAACVHISEIAKHHNIPVGTFLSDTTQLKKWRSLDISMYAIASEHAMIINGFQNIVKDFHH